MTMIGTDAATGARARTAPDHRPGAPADHDTGRQVAMVVAVHDAHRRHHEIDQQWIDALSDAMVAIHAVIDAAGGVPVAVLGERMIASFGAERVADAVGAAITIQRRSASGGASSAAWSCSIGLAAGHASDGLAIEGLPIPTVGGVVDRALQLCALTQAGAILVDDRTIDLIPDDTIDLDDESAGAGRDRTTSAGQAWSTGMSRVVLGPGAEPMACWDLVFDQGPRPDARERRARHGRAREDQDVKDRQGAPVERVDRAERTDLADQADRADRADRAERERRRNGVRDGGSKATVRPAGAPPGSLDMAPVRAHLDSFDRDAPASAPVGLGSRRTWSAGEVVCWFEDRGRGVLASETGQEFYVDRRFLIADQPLNRNAKVYFVPRDPIASGRNPVAGAVLVEGAQVEVRVAHVDDRGFGFAEVSDGNRTRQLLLLDLTGTPGDVTVGDWLRVEVRANRRGPLGLPCT